MAACRLNFASRVQYGGDPRPRARALCVPCHVLPPGHVFAPCHVLARGHLRATSHPSGHTSLIRDVDVNKMSDLRL